MRTSLVIFGVIFLVIGGLLYFIPTQVISADTSTIGNGSTDIRTSSARVTVPIEWSVASAIIGFVLLLLGLVIPGPGRRHDSHDESNDIVEESIGNTEEGDGTHRVVREHSVKHRSR